MTTIQPTGASFKRGKSRQDFATPQDFRDAVVKRWGCPRWDLAADSSNYFASDCHISEEQDSFGSAWHNLPGLLFLNPPFGNITPWAKKCAEESAKGAHILFLTPASIGAGWFQNHVFPNAKVFALSPRLCFDGKAPFPKDCILSEFKPKEYRIYTGVECWRWK